MKSMMSVHDLELPLRKIVRRGRTIGNGKRKVLLGLAKPLHAQSVPDMIESAGDNAEPPESRQIGVRKNLQSFYWRPVFRGSEVATCATLREMSLMAQELLSRKVFKLETGKDRSSKAERQT